MDRECFFARKSTASSSWRWPCFMNWSCAPWRSHSLARTNRLAIEIRAHEYEKEGVGVLRDFLE